MKKVIVPNRMKTIFVKESHGLQIFLRGMIFCCPDIMVASRHLEGVEKKIAKVWTTDLRDTKSKSKHD